MTLSRSNQWRERLLGTPGLSAAEWRLAGAIERLTLGWNRAEAQLGDGLVRATARMDGRSFARARAGLVEKGLIAYTPGRRGRGGRSTYRLLLEGAVENPTAAVENPPEKPALVVSKKPALERGRIDKSKGNRKVFSHSSTPCRPATRANGPGREQPPASKHDEDFDSVALAKIAALSAGLVKDFDGELGP